MTIKPEVLTEFDEWMDFILAEYPSGKKNWQTIRGELLAMDAEIDRLHSGLAKHVDRVCELQSRLEAANALLRSIAAYAPPAHECKQGCPSDMCEACKLSAHLSENGNG